MRSLCKGVLIIERMGRGYVSNSKTHDCPSFKLFVCLCVQAAWLYTKEPKEIKALEVIQLANFTHIQ